MAEFTVTYNPLFWAELNIPPDEVAAKVLSINEARVQIGAQPLPVPDLTAALTDNLVPVEYTDGSAFLMLNTQMDSPVKVLIECGEVGTTELLPAAVAKLGVETVENFSEVQLPNGEMGLRWVSFVPLNQLSGEAPAPDVPNPTIGGFFYFRLLNKDGTNIVAMGSTFSPDLQLIALVDREILALMAGITLA
ncbi:MAG: hypothetical protein LBR20_03410 [Propionibacteriaceae bacterium]|jgi:hypothetical protein|nr:hypothetical protein [Propionibacteriaceae bacterium]